MNILLKISINTFVIRYIIVNKLIIYCLFLMFYIVIAITIITMITNFAILTMITIFTVIGITTLGIVPGIYSFTLQFLFLGRIHLLYVCLMILLV